MAIHSYSQPSSSEANSVNSEPYYYGFVDRCFCGGEVNLQTRTLSPNLGRIYYKCEHEWDGPFHVSKWWDSSVEEEIRTLKMHSDTVDQQLTTITATDIPNLQVQLDRIEDIQQVVLRQELDSLKGKVNKLNTEMDRWSAGFDYLVDYYENRSIKDFFLGALEKLTTTKVWILGLSVGLTVSVATNLYLYVN